MTRGGIIQLARCICGGIKNMERREGRRGAHADIAAARIERECIVGGSRADMRRLDHGVGRVGIT